MVAFLFSAKDYGQYKNTCYRIPDDFELKDSANRKAKQIIPTRAAKLDLSSRSRM